jgi:hypothetical protein
MSQSPLIKMGLVLDGLEADELLELTASLRQELAETDVDAVETVSEGTAPDAAKGIDPDTAQLLVTLAVGLVPTVITVVQGFLLRQRDQNLRIKIKDVELEVPRNARPEEIQELIKTVEKVAKRVN